MFADALDSARQFTRPIFQSVRFYDGTTEGGLATCVFINRDGWFITAAHVLDPVVAAQRHTAEIAQYEASAAAVRANQKLNSSQRHKQLRSLRPNPKWITNHSVVVGVGPTVVQINDWFAARDIDLAVARVPGFDPSWIPDYPLFAAATALRQGTSVCRLGYPFLPVKATFDTGTDRFDLACENLTLFPNEGILSRFIQAQQSQFGPFQVRFMETSSAGLMGQSGGPLLDRRGVVCGIQSHTRSYELGFNPDITLQSGKKVEVYQFMNVGVAVHPQTIHEFLTHLNVQFRSEVAATGGKK